MAAALPFILMGVGTVVSAYGQYSQGQAAAKASQYNAAMADQNSKVQQQNAQIASQSGSQQAAMQSMKTRALVGQTQANQGASGVTINDKGTPSTSDVTLSERELGRLDAVQIRTNATRHAYGYEVAAVNDKAQSQLDRFQATTQKTGSYLNAGGTLLSGAGQSYGGYQKYKQAGGLDSGTSYSGDGNGEW